MSGIEVTAILAATEDAQQIRAMLRDRVRHARSELRFAGRAEDASPARLLIAATELVDAERQLAAVDPLTDDQLAAGDAAREIACREVDEILGRDVDDMIDQLGGAPRHDEDGAVWVVVRVCVADHEIRDHLAAQPAAAATTTTTTTTYQPGTLAEAMA